jgi:bifunctional DNA-binding transcriptional regulator/antitoxin component of YhaV-PrlF toxin-antitoxin module
MSGSREYMNVHPGDRLDFVIRTDGEVVVRPQTLEVTELRGRLRKPGRRPVSLQEMDRAIREQAGRGT